MSKHVNSVWTPEKLQVVKKMRQQRIPTKDIAKHFNVSKDAIDKVVHRNARMMGKYVNTRQGIDLLKGAEFIPYYGDNVIETYDKFEIIKGDSMIIGDTHIPYCDVGMMNKMIKIAKRDKIKTLIVGGDLTDQKTASIHLDVNSERIGRKFDSELSMTFDILEILAKTFDTIVCSCGDHDSRVLKRLNFIMNWKSLGKVCNKILKTNTIRTSDYYYVILKSGGQTFRITHPDRATSRSTTKALALARKFNQNIIQLHGHTFGMEFTENGDYLAVALGCMTDIKHHEYAVIRDVAYPIWKKMFASVINGKVKVYSNDPQLTDWGSEFNVKKTRK